MGLPSGAGMVVSTTCFELIWIGKDVRPKLEPRILIENPEKSYHADFRTTGSRGGAESDEKQNRLFGQSSGKNHLF